MTRQRRLPIGAEVLKEGETHFRVWAPDRQRVQVVLEGRSVTLEQDSAGYFSGLAPVGNGARYRFRLDDDETLYPDPASRFQPEGPHGPSQVIDPRRFAWSDSRWPGAGRDGQVLY